MSVVHEEILVIKLGKLVKETQKDLIQILTQDRIENIEALVQEIIGNDVVVEVEKAWCSQYTVNQIVCFVKNLKPY